MFDFNPVFEFSRTHCISICAFLVPANLVATGVTVAFTVLRRPKAQVLTAAAIAAIPALVMVFHVVTWFMIGVVMAPTYILLWLAATCLSINLWAISHPQSMVRLLKWAWGMISPAFQRRHLT
ncbi:MAG: hypothetical protein KME19_24015 [Microcoleus vaginatus WJT46-NPBG5]|jgi:hypothetical protein|nr:hypothetical protein [Microcoleus vaginatus WJT46-NPBG5]